MGNPIARLSLIGFSKKTIKVFLIGPLKFARERLNVQRVWRVRGFSPFFPLFSCLSHLAPSVTRVAICVSRVSLDGLQKKERLLVVYCQAYANFKSQIHDSERLTVFSQQLPQEPLIPENSSRPLTEFLQFKYRSSTRLSRQSRYKRSKTFWLDQRTCDVRPK